MLAGERSGSIGFSSLPGFTTSITERTLVIASQTWGIFSVWDRLFGTYIDPATVQGELTFGIDADENPIRVVLGV